MARSPVKLPGPVPTVHASTSAGPRSNLRNTSISAGIIRPSLRRCAGSRRSAQIVSPSIRSAALTPKEPSSAAEIRTESKLLACLDVFNAMAPLSLTLNSGRKKCAAPLGGSNNTGNPCDFQGLPPGAVIVSPAARADLRAPASKLDLGTAECTLFGGYGQ